MNCNISSLYICVEDMARAIKFYEDLFEQSVTERDNIYSLKSHKCVFIVYSNSRSCFLKKS